MDSKDSPALISESGARWRNWSGRVRFTPKRQAQPQTLEQLQSVVRQTSDAGRRRAACGSGHSFVPLVETSDTLLDLSGLSGVEAVDGTRATVWAGTSLKPLGGLLRAQGLGMQNLGDINRQALAGAVSTGTHGTGLGLGSISTQVVGMTLVLADGSTLHCSATENPEVFAAARVSLGALGVIAKLQLQLQPAYRLRLQKLAMDLDECLDRAPTLARDHRHFEFYWFPHTRKTGVKLMQLSEEPESRTALTTASEIVIENGALGLISKLARANPDWCAPLSRLMAWSMKGDAGSMVADAHRAFSTVRWVRFNEMEYELPAENGADALRELAEFVERKSIRVHFPVEYRYVQGDDIWLSPFFGRDSVAISVHQYQGMDFRPYFDGAEAIFRNHGGRPHWGKMHSLGATDLAGMYPHWDDFHALRRRLDPQGVFMNPYLQTLFGD